MLPVVVDSQLKYTEQLYNSVGTLSPESYPPFCPISSFARTLKPNRILNDIVVKRHIKSVG